MSNLAKNMMDFDTFIRSKYKEGVLWNYGKPTHPLYADLWDAWQARVPEGYAVVPKEPSEKMVDIGKKYHSYNEFEDDVVDIYKSMIEAVEK